MKRTPHLNNLSLVHQGEMKELYAIPSHPDLLLMVATDAISTHNVVHITPVPLVGQMLTALLVFWAYGPLQGIPTHIFRIGNEIYNYLPQGEYPSDLHLRALVVKKLLMAPYRLIYVRRMLGSLWHDYYKKGLQNPYGINFSRGLKLMSPLQLVVFAPRENWGSHNPANGDNVRTMLSRHVLDLAYKVYERGNNFTLKKGVEIVNFRALVGVCSHNEISLGGEWLTSSCCRFVERNKIIAGEDPPWADREIFRKDAVRQWGGNKSGPPLIFSDEVVRAGVIASLAFFERITGDSLSTFQNNF